jgi:hypothetical protein
VDFDAQVNIYYTENRKEIHNQVTIQSIAITEQSKAMTERKSRLK